MRRLNKREDALDWLRKNALQKSYASPLFLVNEKCKPITQVWQNLALINRAEMVEVIPERARLSAPDAQKRPLPYGFRAPYALSYPFMGGSHRVWLVGLPFRVRFGP
jgi:hypothetical protein